MTQPASPMGSSDFQSRQTPPFVPESEDEESAVYEAYVLTSLTEEILASVQEVIQQLLALVLGDEEEARAQAESLISDVLDSLPTEGLDDLISQGIELGISHSGLTQEALDSLGVGSPTPEEVSALRNALSGFNGPSRAKDEALRLARALPVDDSYGPALAAAVKEIATKAERLAKTVALQAEAEGVLKAARESDSRVVWVNERGACLHCLAYAGVVKAAGESFGLLTYADKPLDLDSLVVEHPDGEVFSPPLHPWCRCRLRVWQEADPREPSLIHDGQGRTGVPNNTTFAEALQREARRAVLRGASDYDSLSARLRAADRLLDAGANLPKTVIRRARRAVELGRFIR